MELSGARVLVAGASGALGGGLARALHAAGASVGVTGRDPDRTAAVAADVGAEPLLLDVLDTAACAGVVDRAAAALGGLDLLVVAVGVPAFGPALTADDAVVEELFAVNVLGPMALVRAASRHLGEGGTVAVLTAVLVDAPTAGLADYSAAKVALSAWLGVVRREERRRLRVLDVRPPHLDTGLAGRALAGDVPRMPEPHPAAAVVEAVVAALAGDSTELVWDQRAKSLTPR